MAKKVSTTDEARSKGSKVIKTSAQKPKGRPVRVKRSRGVCKSGRLLCLMATRARSPKITLHVLAMYSLG